MMWIHFIMMIWEKMFCNKKKIGALVQLEMRRFDWELTKNLFFYPSRHMFWFRIPLFVPTQLLIYQCFPSLALLYFSDANRMSEIQKFDHKEIIDGCRLNDLLSLYIECINCNRWTDSFCYFGFGNQISF